VRKIWPTCLLFSRVVWKCSTSVEQFHARTSAYTGKTFSYSTLFVQKMGLVYMNHAQSERKKAFFVRLAKNAFFHTLGKWTEKSIFCQADKKCRAVIGLARNPKPGGPGGPEVSPARPDFVFAKARPGPKLNEARRAGSGLWWLAFLLASLKKSEQNV